MEKCFYSLENDFTQMDIGEYTRVYIGDEFCDNSLIYNISHIEDLIQKYIGRKDISIVLPVINELLFDKVEALLRKIKKQYDYEFEVICNDLGSYTYFNKEYCAVAGRLLTRVIMHYLVNNDEVTTLQEMVERIELDATNIKRVHSLKRYKKSFYNMYSVYGHSNNRCSYRISEESVCKNECKKKSIILNNTYLHDTYRVVKNVIIHKEHSMNVSGLFDRVVDIYE